MSERPFYQQFACMFSLFKLLESWTCKKCREKLSQQEQFIQDCCLYNKQYPLILLLLRECISPDFLCEGCWKHAYYEVSAYHRYTNRYQKIYANRSN